MLKCEPKSLTFNDVRLNHPHVTNVCITNTLSSPVEFTIKPSSPRYTITPSQASLNAGQSIIVTVRLFLAHYPNFDRGLRGQEDTIQLKSSFFEQKINTIFYLQNVTGRSRSVSPARSGNTTPSRSSSRNNSQLHSSGSNSNSNSNSSANSPNHDKRVIGLLEGVIKELESKNPQLQEIIERKMNVEKLVFEKKSEKILEILKKKDARIAELQDELAYAVSTSSRIKASSSSDGNKRTQDVSSSSVTSGPAANHEDMMHLRQELSALQQKTMDQTEQIQKLLSENHTLKGELDQQKTVPSASVPVSPTVAGFTSTASSLHHLQTSLASVNKELLQEREKSNNAQQETIIQQQENNKLQQSVLKLQRENTTLREQLSVTEEELSKQKADYSKLEDEFKKQLREVNDAADKAVQSAVKTATGMDRWGSMHYMSMEDLKTPGSVPHGSPHGPESSSVLREHLSNNPNSNTSTKLISIYQEKLTHADTINAELRGILETMRQAEQASSEREAVLQEKCNQYERNISELQNKLRNNSVDQQQLIGKIADLEVVVNRYKESGNGPNGSGGYSSNDYAVDMDVNDAHAWWGYVFHECRKEQREDQRALEDIVMGTPGATETGVKTQVGITSGVATTTVGAATAFNRLTGEDQLQRTETLTAMGSTSSVMEGDALSNIEKLQQRISAQRIDLRNQAVELATVRQMLLSHQLNAKYEVEKMKDEVLTLQRENIRISTHARIHQEDKEVKISELNSTIRILSSKSDLHAQLMAARQELETERVTVHHLRADGEGYRTLLDLEQEKYTALRKQLLEVQSKIESAQVMKTVMDIPGVNPCTVMELFSEQILELRKQLAISKQSHAEAQTKCISLQEDLRIQKSLNASNGKSNNSKLSDSSVEGVDSPASKVTKAPESWKKKLKSNIQLGDLNVEHREATEQASSAASSRPIYGGLSSDVEAFLNILVDGSATPQAIVNCLKAASLGESILYQEKAIADLISHTQTLENQLKAQEKSHGDELDQVEKRTKYELEAAIKRKDILEAANDEYKHEMVLLRKRACELEKIILSSEFSSISGVGKKTTGESSDVSANQKEVLELMHNAWVKASHAIPVDCGQGPCEAIDDSTAVREKQNALLGRDEPEISSLYHDNEEYSDYGDALEDLGEMHRHEQRHGTAGRARIQSNTEDRNGGGVSSHAYEKVVTERDELKSLLRERTNQLKILTETIDALHEMGLNGVESTGNVSGTAGPLPEEDTLESLANQPLQTSFSDVQGQSRGLGSGQGWKLQGLIKRVIELSAELTSQASLAGLEERRANQLDMEGRSKTKEINRLKSVIRKESEKHSELVYRNKTAANSLRAVEQNYAQVVYDLKEEKDAMCVSMKELEIELHDKSVLVEQLTQQLASKDDSDEGKGLREWLEGVITLPVTTQGQISPQSPLQYGGSMDGAVGSTSDTPRSPGSVSASGSVSGTGSDVKRLLNTLLTQWKEQVGYFPTPSQQKRGSTTSNVSNATGGGSTANPGLVTYSANLSLTKEEQKYYQRIVDMVLGANEKATKAMLEASNNARKYENCQLSVRVMQEKLESCMVQLHRYRKRSMASEKILSTVNRGIACEYNALVSHLRKTIAELSSKLAVTTDHLNEERRNFLLCQIKYSASHQNIRKLQADIAMHEAKGNSYLRARDNALFAFEKRIQNAESNLHKWFKVELPRLIGGLPISEEYIGITSDIYYSSKGGGYGVSSDENFDHNAIPSSHLVSSIGLERTEALSQALCASKAVQAAQEIKLTSLVEKNSILKERVVDLEGVIVRWKQEVMAAPIENAHQAVMLNKLKDSVEIESSISKKYNAEILSLKAKITELEEENIEKKTKLVFSLQQTQELKKLMDIVINEEDDLKVKTTNQLTKIRVELENAHANELRSVREAYENENHSLHEELLRVASVLNTTAHAMGSDELDGDFNGEELLGGEVSSPRSSEDGDTSEEKTGRHSVKFSHPRTIPTHHSPKLNIIPLRTALSTPSERGGVIRDAAEELRNIIAHRQNRTHTNIGSNSNTNDVTISQSEPHNRGEPAPAATLGEQLRSAGVFSADSNSSAQRSNADTNTNINHTNTVGDPGEAQVENKLLEFLEDKHHPVGNSKGSMEQKIAELQLEIEHQKEQNVAAKAEIEELNQLLSVQRSQFGKHLDEGIWSGGPGSHSGTPGGIPGVVRTDGDSAIPDNQSRGREAMDAVEHANVSGEDPSLWPSLSSLTNEIMGLLRNIIQRYDMGRDGMVRSVMDMCGRLALIANSNHRIGTTKYRGEPQNGENPLSSSLQHASVDLPTHHSHSNSRLDTNVIDSLQNLSSRVKGLESEFTMENIPERHLYLLRDLRLRVSEIESTVLKVSAEKEALWSAEKNQLLNDNRRLSSELTEYQEEYETTLQRVRDRYEAQLKEAQEALELQTSGAAAHMGRLEDMLTRVLRQQAAGTTGNTGNQVPTLAELIDMQRSRVGDGLGSVDSNSRVPPPPSTLPPLRVERSGAAQTVSFQENAMNVQTDLRQQLHVSPQDTIRSQAVVIENLKKELSELEKQTGKGSGAGVNVSATNALLLEESNVALSDANDRLRELQYHFKTKSKQLNAVLSALSSSSNNRDVGFLFKRKGRAKTMHSPPKGKNQRSSNKYHSIIGEDSFALSDSDSDVDADSQVSSGDSSSLTASIFLDDYSLTQPHKPLSNPNLRDSGAASVSASGAVNLFESDEGQFVFDEYDSLEKLAGAELESSDYANVNIKNNPSEPKSKPESQFEENIHHPDKKINSVVRKALSLSVHAPSRVPLGSENNQKRLERESVGNNTSIGGEHVSDGLSDDSSRATLNKLLSPRVKPPLGMGRSDTTSTNHSNAKQGDVIENVRNSLIEARIAAADEEVSVTHKALSEEKRVNAELKQQLQQLLLAQRELVVQQQQSLLKEEQEALENVQQALVAEGHRIDDLRRNEPHQAEIEAVNGVRVESAQDPLLFSEDGMELVAPPDSSERVQLLIKRMNEMRKQSKAEIFRQKQELLNLKGLYVTAQEELGVLRSTTSDTKESVQSLREDNTRKSKLILQLKQAKATDAKALEHWQHECETLEAKLKQLTRNLNTKEQYVRDMKNKLDATLKELHELQAQQQSVSTIATSRKQHKSMMDALGIHDKDVPQSTKPDSAEPVQGDSYYDANPNLSAAELRNRLRASELDRIRTKNRIKEVREKCVENEKIISNLKEEVEKYKKQSSVADNLKNSIAKKEAYIKSLRAQTEKRGAECEDLKAKLSELVSDSEKKIRQLRRQVETLERQRDDLHKEIELIKERFYLTNSNMNANIASTRTTVTTQNQHQQQNRSVRFSNDNRLRGVEIGSGGGTRADDASVRYTNNPLQEHPQPQSKHTSESQAFAQSHRYPSALDSSTDDLNDVIAALGGDFTAVNSDSYSSTDPGASDSHSFNLNDSGVATENRLKDLIANAINH